MNVMFIVDSAVVKTQQIYSPHRGNVCSDLFISYAGSFKSIGTASASSAKFRGKHKLHLLC